MGGFCASQQAVCTPKSWLAVQAAVRVCGATIAEATTASSLASGAVRVGAAVVGSHQRQQAVAPSKMVQAATAHQGQPCSYHAQRREGSPGREIHRPLLQPRVMSAPPPCRGPPRARSHDGGCQCAAAGRAGSPNAPHNFSLNETETAKSEDQALRPFQACTSVCLCAGSSQ